MTLPNHLPAPVAWEEECLVEEAKRASLACPSPVSKEQRHIEQVKRESLKALTADRGMRKGLYHWEAREAVAVSPFTRDDFRVTRATQMEDIMDASWSSSMSDRKMPALGSMQGNDFELPRKSFTEFSYPSRESYREEYSLPSEGKF